MALTSDADSTVESYDSDIEVQWISRNSAMSEADGAYFVDNYEVAGGLERGEVAELRNIEVTGAFLWSGDPENMHGRWQVGTDASPQFNHGAFGFGEDGTIDATETESGNAISAGGNVVDDVETDVWLMAQPHQTTLDAGGTQAGWSGHMMHQHFDLAAIGGGKGPTYDRHHDIWEHFVIEGNVGGNNVSWYRTFALYWNVYEED